MRRFVGRCLFMVGLVFLDLSLVVAGKDGVDEMLEAERVRLGLEK